MSGEVHLCEACGREIGPDEVIVRAASQVEAGSREGIRQYVEGISSLFHVRHYPADDLRWREKAGGPLSEVTRS